MTFSTSRLAAVLIAISVLACDRGESLEDLARVAKAEGKNETSIRVLDSEVPSMGLRDLLSDASMVVVEVSRPAVFQQVERDWIWTWHVAGLREALVEHRRPATSCRPIPRSVQLDSSQVSIPLLGGSTVLRGVTVRFQGPLSHFEFEQGRVFLIIGTLCNGGVLMPVHHTGVIEVRGGKLAVGDPMAEFEAELRDLATLENVRSFVKAKP